MVIPKSFVLGGRTWKVLLKSQALMDKMSEEHGLPCGDGMCSYQEARIFISKACSEEVRDITFEHELLHAIQFTMGMTDHDEDKIDAHAHLRHQVNKTQRGEQ